jgi:ribosomal protein S11
MATNNAAELLIRIAADPSQAESSIQEFRSNFSGNLSGMGSDLSQWSSRGTSSFGNVQKSLQGLTGNFSLNLGSLNTALNRNRETLSQWGSGASSAFSSAMSASNALGTSLLGSFQLFDSALARNIGNANVWQKSIGQAFEKAALSSIGAIAKEAVVRAIYSTALGFYLLAVGDFAGAGQAFEAAAVFGAVGGAAGLATKALSGAGSSGSTSQKASSGSTSAGSQSSAAKTASSQSSSQKSQTVQVIFQGPVYGGQAGVDELVRHISTAVMERDVNLVAYTVVRQPATRA